MLPLIEARDRFADTKWTARPVLAGDAAPEAAAKDVISPADGSIVGQVLRRRPTRWRGRSMPPRADSRSGRRPRCDPRGDLAPGRRPL